MPPLNAKQTSTFLIGLFAFHVEVSLDELWKFHKEDITVQFHYLQSSKGLWCACYKQEIEIIRQRTQHCFKGCIDSSFFYLSLFLHVMIVDYSAHFS